MGDRPSFRRPAAAGGELVDKRFIGLVGVAVIVAVALIFRSAWEPRLPPGNLVEVVGEVPNPGLHLLDETPTIAEAVAAAGGSAEGLPNTAVHEGDRVVVAKDGVHVAPSGNPLLVALPVDLNSADAAALEAIPGIGEATARAIVADREANGPFRSVDELDRVQGLTPAAVEALAPFATVPGAKEWPADGPIDINHASAKELERLPGIGPVMAARIVVDREDHGPYATVDDLGRIKGIGPATIDKLRAHAVATP